MYCNIVIYDSGRATPAGIVYGRFMLTSITQTFMGIKYENGECQSFTLARCWPYWNKKYLYKMNLCAKQVPDRMLITKHEWQQYFVAQWHSRKAS